MYFLNEPFYHMRRRHRQHVARLVRLFRAEWRKAGHDDTVQKFRKDWLVSKRLNPEVH